MSKRRYFLFLNIGFFLIVTIILATLFPESAVSSANNPATERAHLQQGFYDQLAAPVEPTAVEDPVNCNSFTSPVVGYEISKGQSPDNVIDFLNDLELDGFSVGTVDISAGAIPNCVDVLIIRGLAGDVTLISLYTTTEAATLQTWVTDGHGLMVAGDWGILKDDTQALFQTFGYSQVGDDSTYVTDPTDNDPTAPGFVGDGWVIFQADNFAPHPIFEGVGTLELLLSGWLAASPDSVVTTDSDASPSLVPVIVAGNQGSGCVLFSGDSNWIAIYNDGYFKEDNAQIARQSVAWLNNCNFLNLTKTAVPNPVEPNEQITYTLTTTNFETSAQTNVTISDQIPAGTMFSSASMPYSGPDTNNVVTWSVGTLNPGESATVTLIVQVDDGVTDGTLITNTADVSSSEGSDDSATAVVEVTNITPPIGMTSYTMLPIVMLNFCQETSRFSDIVLALDTSGSMDESTEPGGPTKLEAARTAATEFLNLLAFPRDQASLILFSGTAVLQHPLSNNRATLIAALQGNVSGDTRIDLAFAEARKELVSVRHIANNSQVLILLTDGRPIGTNEAAVLAEAAVTKAAGITIYTIGLGSDVNVSLLRDIASTSDHYYPAPSTADLSQIYQEIAGSLGCP